MFVNPKPNPENGFNLMITNEFVVGGGASRPNVDQFARDILEDLGLAHGAGFGYKNADGARLVRYFARAPFVAERANMGRVS